MKTIDLTPDEMEQRIVRFRQLKPRSLIAQDKTGIPSEVTRSLAADRNYTYMAPVLPNNSAITENAALRGGDAGNAISVSLAICDPGYGPQLHAHARTVESFFCISGRFSITWGDKGQHTTVLEPLDFIAIPKGVVRTFKNVSDEKDAKLLVIIQGDKQDFGDVYFVPEVAQMLMARFGPDIKAKLEATGRRFTAGVPEPTDV